MGVISRRAPGHARAYNHIGAFRAASGSTTSQAQSVAYVHQTSGNAFAFRYVAERAGPINAFWIFCPAIAGTGGTVRARIYNEQAAQASRPGSTLRATNTAADTPAANKWIKITFGTPYSCTKGEILWIVIDNTDGVPATNNWSLWTVLTPNYQTQSVSTLVSAQFYSTTGGFSANGTDCSRTPWMMDHGGVIYGLPYTNGGTTFALDTQKKGIKFFPHTSLKIDHIEVSPQDRLSKLQIYGPGQLPNDTPLHEFNFDTDANQTTNDYLGTKIFDAVTLYAGLEYRLVFTLSLAAVVMNGGSIGDYVGGTYESTIDAIRLDPINTHTFPIATVDSGSNTWTDDKTHVPGFRVGVSEYLGTPSFSAFAG